MIGLESNWIRINRSRINTRNDENSSRVLKQRKKNGTQKSSTQKKIGLHIL